MNQGAADDDDDYFEDEHLVDWNERAALNESQLFVEEEEEEDPSIKNIAPPELPSQELQWCFPR